MNKRSDDCSDQNIRSDTRKNRESSQKSSSTSQGSGKTQDGHRPGRPPRQRNGGNPKQKEQKHYQNEAAARPGRQDKEVISWLNKKITSKERVVHEKKTIHTKGRQQSSGRFESSTNWREESSSEQKSHCFRDSEYSQNKHTRGQYSNNRKQLTGRRQQSVYNQSSGSPADASGQNNANYSVPNASVNVNNEPTDGQRFGYSSSGQSLFETRPTKSSHFYSNEVFDVGSNVNVINGRYVRNNTRANGSVHEDVSNDRQHHNEIPLAATDLQYNQYSDIGLNPQVYVYGGLHVYNMPIMDQQYYAEGQQWYNDKEYQTWNQPVNQQVNQFNANKMNGSDMQMKKESKKVKEQKIKIKVDPNHSVQANVLTEQLVNESYECMVCCEKIRCHAQIWSCDNCFHVFHLRCVRKWANSPAASVEGGKGGWRCPACQDIKLALPNVYQCFCGKSINPVWNPREGITPHSCGELCQKKRDSSSDCPHLCNQLCHPGPCPSCPVMVSKSCFCGKLSQQSRCGLNSVIQCKEVCSKTLNCGVHSCDRICHEGSCDMCDVEEEQACYCGSVTRKAKCGSGTLNAEGGIKSYFSCKNLCQRTLDCGNHQCDRVCHSGKCKPCNLMPSRVKHCPCGKVLLDNLLTEQRLSCLDPIPTCNNVCNKVLPCSPPTDDVSSQHRCKLSCHHGKCGPCDGLSTLNCRCGAETKEAKCSEVNGEVYLCGQRCNKKRQCGRHRCNQKCCVDKDHKCELVCGKKLQCGVHTCEELCHRGYCPSCYMTGFEEVTCHCGSTIMYPPIPCGTPPPECTKPCSRIHSCSHAVNHLCHSEEVCPPCTILTKKMCNGNHQLRLNVPCHVLDVSCGNRCGSKLKCGHNCIKWCHKPPCDTEPCSQPCGAKRKECEHLCNSPCHYGSSCPDIPCQVKITISCKCGRRSENVPCLQGGDKTALAQFYQRITTESLANKMKDVQMGQSVDISTVIMRDDKSARYIECNDECAHMERVRRMTVALGIEDNEDQSQRILFSPFLINEAKSNLTFIKSIEEAFENLVSVASKLTSGQKSHSFPPMNSNHRRIIHELAIHYACSSVSYDPEPKRNTVITAYRNSHLPPSTLSSQVEKLKNPPPPPPVPFVPSGCSIKTRNTKENQEDKKTKTWGQVPDYFADDFAD